MGWLNRFASTCFTLLTLTILGTGVARAELPATAPVEPGLVASPKGDGSTLMPMRRTTQAMRVKAALASEKHKSGRAARDARRDAWLKAHPGVKMPAPKAAQSPAVGGFGMNGAVRALAELALGQVGTADLYADPNFANSTLPTATCSVSNTACKKDIDCPLYADPIIVGTTTYPGGETCTGPRQAGGIQKFVNKLPPLCALGANEQGACLPIATPDTTSFPGADFYTLGLHDFTQVFHPAIPATPIRGYVQLDAQGNQIAGGHYLGPIILAQRNRPVRVLFRNTLPADAKLFLPVDPTIAGAGKGPDNLTTYTEARAAIHLHGGNTPWISDGTQHQWTAPEGYAGNGNAWEKKGLAVGYVPDMWFLADGTPVPACNGLTTCPVAGATNNPGDGRLTYYWTNQQSTRLLWYHDHAYGITRLNAYAGEASGYLLVDPNDEDALAAAGVPGTVGSGTFGSTDPTATAPDLAHFLPLIIQEKTFVPPTAQLAEQDPTWDVVKWGGEGALWFPHVYPPNQWPDDPTNANANPMGRWDYGPWFWPPQRSLAEVDNAGNVINVPLTVPCVTKALPIAVDVGGNQIANTQCPSIPNPTIVPESFLDTPIVNGAAYPVLEVEPRPYRFMILNGSQERNWNLSFFQADPAAPTEVQMVDATPHSPLKANPADGLRLCKSTDPIDPVTGIPVAGDASHQPIIDPVTGKPVGCWPTTWPVDGRYGGVPDPRTAGPQIIQIGSEGGILPSPAVIPANPTNYEYNRRNIVVLNVSDKALFMGPAERADIVVDFSAYAGQTLILYNDAPAPVPASDPRLDYFTGNLDQTSSGGAPTTLPGYGPNTRTIMQIKVAAAATGPVTPFDLATVSAAVASAFKTSQPEPIIPQTGYNAAMGTSYAKETYLPIDATQLTFTPVCGDPAVNTCANQPLTLDLGNKALHELFDTDHGRMNSLLGVEIPLTTWVNQTTIPFANFDPATEYITDGQPQIWKITHNGVDTHTIHFHLVNLQIINRVGWDGQIRAPDANELGWKEAVRMHPLEDIYVAMKQVKQTLPWPIPDLIRPMDVTRPLGTTTQFTGVDINNNPTPIANAMMNYGWEYVWHCHLLGHEEGDMLRAEIFITPPEAPTALTAVTTIANASRATLTWTDNSKSAQAFTVQRSLTADFANPTTLPSAAAPGTQPGTVTYTDTSFPGTAVFYRVQGTKTFTTPAIPDASYTSTSGWSNVAQVVLPPNGAVTPTDLAFPDTRLGTTSAARSVTLTNTGGLAELVYTKTVTGLYAATDTCNGIVAVNTSCIIGITFTPTVLGANPGSLAISTNDPAHAVLTVTLSGNGVAPPAAPSNLAGTASGNAASLTWRDNSTNETAFLVQRLTFTNGVPGTFRTIATLAANIAAYVDNTAAAGVLYAYRIGATNAIGTTFSNTVTFPAIPAAPTSLVVVAVASGASLTWIDNAVNETSYSVERAPVVNGTIGTYAPITSVVANTTSYVDTTVAVGSFYMYRVAAVNLAGTAYSGVVQYPTYPKPTAPTRLTAVAARPGVSLAWQDNSNNEATFWIQRLTFVNGVPGTYKTIATVPFNTTSYVDLTAGSGTPYAYRIGATNISGTTYSNQVAITPP